MIKVGNLVLYKKQAARVASIEDGKLVVEYMNCDKVATQKVREKDVASFGVVAKSIKDVISDDGVVLTKGEIHDAWELLGCEGAAAFSQIYEIIKSGSASEILTPREMWHAFLLLESSEEFTLDTAAVKNGEIVFNLRSAGQIEAAHQKEYALSHEAELFDAFIKRVQAVLAGEAGASLDGDDRRRMQEVELAALAHSKTSKILAALKLPFGATEAHKLLLQTGLWDITRNPFPARFNLSTTSAKGQLGAPPAEKRHDLSPLSYAIDNAWSDDPDDAICFDGEALWVHIADPASSVLPDSPIDKAARERGSTLYIPEGCARMLCESCLSDYALGLKDATGGAWDNALSFKITIADDGSVADCDVQKTRVHVKRLTYEAATTLNASDSDDADVVAMHALFEIAKRNIERRDKAGATNIDLPDVHITIKDEPMTVGGKTFQKTVFVEKEEHFEAQDVVREAMLLACEGAAIFAYRNKIPFPYISQEAKGASGDDVQIGGLAGEFKKLRGMKKRNVSVTPAMHCGLGLGFYSQVTSPLRRYIDLIAHEQLRAFLDKRKLIDKDDMFMRITESDIAVDACKKASRKTDLHWILIYLLEHPDWEDAAVCIDYNDYTKESTLCIPALAQQTKIRGKQLNLNDTVKVRAANIDIPTQHVDFIIV